jgi:hypothetical protein
MSEPELNGGSPVTDPANPYGAGATSSERNVLGSLPVEARGEMALGDLDGSGSGPTTDDAASARPLSPPTTASSAG